MTSMQGEDHVVQRRRGHRHPPPASACGAARRRGAASGQGLADRGSHETPPESPRWALFHQGLREFGYVEGQNIAFE